MRRQGEVIEIIPDSQAGEICEGEERVKMAEEAGVAREDIESVRMMRGRMWVKIKEGEEERIGKRRNKARPIDGKAAA